MTNPDDPSEIFAQECKNATREIVDEITAMFDDISAVPRSIISSVDERGQS